MEKNTLNIKTWIGVREATRSLADLGCGYNHLNAKRKAGELDGLCVIDDRTKQGHWLYDVDGIREKVMSGKLYFGHRRPPVIKYCYDIAVTISISPDLADELLKCNKDAEATVIQEIRNAVSRVVGTGGGQNL